MYDSNLNNNLTGLEVYVNHRIKVNPRNGDVIEDVISDRAIFRIPGEIEGCEDKRKLRLSDEGGTDGKDRSAKRAKKHVFEYAVCNEFEWFVTLTLDKNMIDRYDYKTVIKKLNRWLSDLVKRHGFRYLFVPELHKDGAIHFHGLCTGDGLKTANSGRRDKSKRDIYNILNWRLGFTTAVRLDGDYSNVCKYVTKYIKKGMTDGTIGGRYYFHGGDLAKAQCFYSRYDGDFDAAGGFLVDIPDARLHLRYFSTTG